MTGRDLVTEGREAFAGTNAGWILWATRNWSAVEAALQAAQRPPLGYVVLSRNPDSGRLQPHGRVHAEVEHAADWRQHLEIPGGPRIPVGAGTEFLVAELREVQL